MKKSIYTYLLALGCLVASCSDDFLEEKNPNTIPSELFWTTLQESNINLTSVYGAMLNNYLFAPDIEAWRSDLGFPKDRRRLNSVGAPWYRKTYNINTRNYQRSWDAMYQVIFRANQVIRGLNSMTDDLKEQDEWKSQMGQARFFRGLMHFYLHATYNNGKIVIRDEISYNLSENSKSVSSYDEVVAFFREDLEYAYNNLPATFEGEKTRVSKGLAATVLGKSFLYEGEYNEAKEYLLDVITNSDYGYRLLENDEVNLLFTHAGDYNDESIFEINYSERHQQQEGTFDEESFFNRFARYAGPTGNIKGGALLVPTSWITYEYSAEELDSNDPRNYVEDENGVSQLRNVSLRASQMITLVNDESSEYYGAEAANQIITFGGTTFSYYKKFTNHDIATSEENILETAWKSGKNYIVYRLADVYLMYAECLIQEDNIDEAVDYINKIRRRWGLVLLGASDGSPYDFDEVVYTKESLMERLMHIERPLEVSNEGYAERHIDLRRWGQLATRYSDLAAMEFELVSYLTASGTNRANSLIQKGLTPGTDPSDFTNAVNVEFNEASSNYIPSLHDYYELPTSETLYNRGDLQ